MKKFLSALLLVIFSTGLFAQGVVRFLKENEAPSSLQLLPPAPMPNDAIFAYDYSQYLWGKLQRNTSRGQVAVSDSRLNEDSLLKNFSPCFGLELSKAGTPELARLIIGISWTSDYCTKEAKEHYMRVRPFVLFEESSLTPWDEADLSKNGSYPSGHTTIGWAIALVLAEINVERQNEIFKYGYEFGQSRVICGVHYQSDVDAGRVLAAAYVARLHASDSFNEQLKKAKAEFNRLKKK